MDYVVNSTTTSSSLLTHTQIHYHRHHQIRIFSIFDKNITIKTLYSIGIIYSFI